MKGIIKSVVITNEFLDDTEELTVTLEHWGEGSFDVELSKDGDSVSMSLEQLKAAVIELEKMAAQYEVETEE